ncbi:hypothetical protein B0H10DRAFT_2192594 [Mycena sp. CBHHK59/15]|nr:hypothetical protein B0H10DRAFT_2192594 [Mycena sp. CBHHK59/15]
MIAQRGPRAPALQVHNYGNQTAPDPVGRARFWGFVGFGGEKRRKQLSPEGSVRGGAGRSGEPGAEKWRCALHGERALGGAQVLGKTNGTGTRCGVRIVAAIELITGMGDVKSWLFVVARWYGRLEWEAGREEGVCHPREAATAADRQESFVRVEWTVLRE